MSVAARHNRFSFCRLLWLVPALALAGGCGSDDGADTPGVEPGPVQDILKELDNDPIPVFYLRSDNDELVPLDTDQGNTAVHDGVVCFRALTCKNPNCPKAGQKNVFSQKVPGYSVDERGILVYPTDGPRLGPLQCPHCQGYEVEDYLPPDLKKKLEARKQELLKARRENEMNTQGKR